MKPFVLSLVALVIGCAGTVHAELTPEQTKTARALITQFSDRRFAIRQQAVDKLVAMGPDVLPMVRKTLAATDDHEVKLRCRMVLRGLAETYALDVADDTGEPGVLKLGPSRITIDEDRAPLSEVLDALAKQSGNRRVSVTADLAKKPVKLHLEGVRYFEALDQISRTVGCQYESLSTSVAFKLRPTTVLKDLGAFAGPAVVKVNTVARSQSQGLTFRGYTSRSDSRALSIRLDCYIEDRLPLTYSRVWFTRVHTPAGVDWVNAGGKRLGYYSATPTNRYSGIATLYVTGRQADVKGPVTIEGVVCLEFGIGKKELRFDRLFAGRERKQDEDLTLTLLAAGRDGHKATVSLEVTSEYHSYEALLKNQTEDYGLFLIDPKGGRHSRIASSRWSGQSVDRGGVRHGRLDLVMGAVPEVAGKWSLLVVRPERIERREYPFRIGNVPTP